jgi:hypothetical protein
VAASSSGEGRCTGVVRLWPAPWTSTSVTGAPTVCAGYTWDAANRLLTVGRQPYLSDDHGTLADDRRQAYTCVQADRPVAVSGPGLTRSGNEAPVRSFSGVGMPSYEVGVSN